MFEDNSKFNRRHSSETESDNNIKSVDETQNSPEKTGDFETLYNSDGDIIEVSLEGGVTIVYNLTRAEILAELRGDQIELEKAKLFKLAQLEGHIQQKIVDEIGAEYQATERQINEERERLAASPEVQISLNSLKSFLKTKKESVKSYYRDLRFENQISMSLLRSNFKDRKESVVSRLKNFNQSPNSEYDSSRSSVEPGIDTKECNPSTVSSEAQTNLGSLALFLKEKKEFIQEHFYNIYSKNRLRFYLKKTERIIARRESWATFCLSMICFIDSKLISAINKSSADWQLKRKIAKFCEGDEPDSRQNGS